MSSLPCVLQYKASSFLMALVSSDQGATPFQTPSYLSILALTREDETHLSLLHAGENRHPCEHLHCLTAHSEIPSSTLVSMMGNNLRSCWDHRGLALTFLSQPMRAGYLLQVAKSQGLSLRTLGSSFCRARPSMHQELVQSLFIYLPGLCFYQGSWSSA